MIISNSSPLILLAKISKLNILEKLHKKITIPYAVYNEVIINGKSENYSDAALIEKSINEFIFVKHLNQGYKTESEKLSNIIGSGESEAIALCIQEKAELLLIDNFEPRKIAQSKGMKCRSTPGILLEALKKNIISSEEYESGIKDLSKYAWLSGDVVAHFLYIGYKIKQGESK